VVVVGCNVQAAVDTEHHLIVAHGPMASAQGDLEVDVELVIAVDVSRSMTPRELEIQRRGYEP